MAQPDYYAVLGVLPTAPDDEITRAWRRLVLASHPDKTRTAPAQTDIRLVNEARAVLSDPVRRAAFDAQRVSNHAAPPPPSGPRIREHVSLEAFTAHPSAEEPERFTLECRCGQEYVVTVDELEAGVDVVGCPGCGEYVGVDYEVVEEE
ncbi:DnaJ-domain-containing protein [Cutaneotrichosporon oleaginosum]|uniref:Diphthamide biosynthesis protein 4 n=1 Tax=Cutaneotrichosporon oleaginosum TaxID=879819 RepID=A0A0J0XKU1_9TREE|nr:DnaJ-domain-containing protein [Cutaneotrichosporon oleaginosum]KLT41700.1 DnaJ-domain-containing protein [Cutaneotrichosporon oleaginosum]TXT08072.1 hypothetical protein COLE_04996 [Cutaneotrichosporon oleaginosum]